MTATYCSWPIDKFLNSSELRDDIKDRFEVGRNIAQEKQRTGVICDFAVRIQAPGFSSITFVVRVPIKEYLRAALESSETPIKLVIDKMKKCIEEIIDEEPRYTMIRGIDFRVYTPHPVGSSPDSGIECFICR